MNKKKLASELLKMAKVLTGAILSKRYEELFGELVPSHGKSGTLEGEILRAFSKIGYRAYNDGDVPTKGYGVETVGSALIFLMDNLPSQLRSMAHELERADTSQEVLNVCKKWDDKLVAWIDERKENGGLEKSNLDMLDYDSEAMSRWDSSEEEDLDVSLDHDEDDE